jgi:myo-inositol 2-dehydrogenase / D-chiro-inositol 1-dehydrogenase
VTVRIGVVGLGRIGELHAQNLAASGLVSSLLVHDVDEERARRVASDVDAGVASSVPELLKQGVDGVVIAAPTETHAHLVTVALLADVAVFCEKPLAGSLEAGFSLTTLAEARRLPLQVGLQRRCDPQLLEVRERLQSQADGCLLGLRIVSSSWQPPPPAYLRTSGGFFRDKLLHDVDVVRWVTGRAIDAAAVLGSGAATGWIGDGGDVDTVSASLLLAGGVVAQIWAARSSPTRFEFRLDTVTERQAMSAGRWTEGDPSETVRQASPYATFVARFSEAYSSEMASFCRLAAGAGENVCTASDAMASEVATVALERAWREARVVRPGEVEAVRTRGCQ